MPMSPEKMLSLVHKMTHLALSHPQMMAEGGEAGSDETLGTRIGYPGSPPPKKQPTQNFDFGGNVLGPQVPGSIAPTTNPNLLLSGPGTTGTAVTPNPSGGILGGINSFLGTNVQGGAAANINNGTNTGQLNQAYTSAQGALGNAGTVANATLPGVRQGVGSQNLLTNELAAETQGQGPNPAQAALNTNTGTNVANTAALMAGQRGASANPGLIAQEAAGQGAATQQAAVGQEAQMEAQQRLNAQNALQGVAATQVAQGTGATSAANAAQQGEQGILQGANTAANNANVQMQTNLNNVNEQAGQANATNNQNILGSIGSKLPLIGGLFAEGGKVPSHINHMAKLYHGGYFKGGNVRNVGMRLKSGGAVPGHPMVDHDAYKNDTVSAKLTPGEVVIDLNTLRDKGQLGKMARYVAANIARKKMGRAA